MSDTPPTSKCPFDPAAGDAKADRRDPFRAAREDSGILRVRAEGEDMPMVLRLQDVRKTAKDWKTFSNDDPLMIVLHSEADVRSVRQLPIETDPPQHTAYRQHVEPLFRRPQQPEYLENIRAMVADTVVEALAADEIEAVRSFALPLQSRGLTRLLGMPDAEADIWINWGTHVYRDGDDPSEKGSVIDTYFHKTFAAATDPEATDFFSFLNHVDFEGRPLTDDEKHGYAHMTFAGGRDTVISTLSSIVAHVAEHPETLDFLREDADRITTATEEFVRFVSPVTALARRCPHGGTIPGADVEVPAGGRLALCWPSANRDAKLFKDPDEIKLDRAPNPHVGFGFGAHNCLGQHQARALIRSLLQELCAKVQRIELIEAVPEIEKESSYERQTGYARLRVRFHG